jgi:hypothetical protein
MRIILGRRVGCGEILEAFDPASLLYIMSEVSASAILHNEINVSLGALSPGHDESCCGRRKTYATHHYIN